MKSSVTEVRFSVSSISNGKESRANRFDAMLTPTLFRPSLDLFSNLKIVASGPSVA
jgi:hypothetical protein